METIKNISILIMSLLLLGSCNKEGLAGGELAPGTVQVQLVVPTAQIEKTATRATFDGTAQENFVGKVQMLFWNVDKGKVERYIAIAPGNSPIIDASTQWNTTNGTLTVRGVNSTDKIVIYAMANGQGDELSGNFATQEAILDAIAEHSGAITDIAITPLPMSGISTATTFAVDNSTKVAIELRRTVAKVNITVALGANFIAAYPELKLGQAAGEAATLELIKVPGVSYVFSKTPIAMPADAKFGKSSLPVVESGVAQTMIWKATAYVFENPTIDPKTSMKISLNLPYKDGANAIVTGNAYEVEINHAAANRVVRNHIYYVTMTINGFGKDNITTSTIVELWNVENIDIPVAGGYVRIESIKAGISDLSDDPDYKYPIAGVEIEVELVANIGGTVLKVIDENGTTVAESNPSKPTNTTMRLNVPNNVGVENGLPVAPRSLTLQITNSNTKMHFNSDVAVAELRFTHRQAAVMWANKNIGAATTVDAGNVYQYDRNNPFPLTPSKLTSLVAAPISKEDAVGQYSTTFITAPTNADLKMMTWADAAGTGNIWQTPASNPCHTYGDASIQWRMPTQFDYNVVQGLLRTKNPDGKFGWDFQVTGAKLFFPFAGVRRAEDSEVIGTDVNGGTSYWTTTTDLDGGIKVFDIGVAVRVIPKPLALGCPIRCVKDVE